MLLQIKNVIKKAALTALLLTLTLTMLLSCGQNKNGGSDNTGNSDGKTDVGGDGEILSAADKKRYEDTTVYSNYGYARGVYFVTDRKNLSMVKCDDPENVHYAHSDPNCAHNKNMCPCAGEIETIMTVDAEWSDYPLVYIFYDEFGSVADMHHDKWCTIKELNVGTNSIREVTNELQFNTDFAMFYRGRLYVCDGANERRSVCCVDVRTGEFKRIEGEGGAVLMGIYNDRIWYMNDRGTICSDSIDLDDMREEYACGVPKKVDDGFLKACIDENGNIYFERNVQCDEDMPDAGFFYYSDLYTVNINDLDAGERFIDSGVVRFKASGGILYYTKLHYEDFGPLITVDGVELEHPITADVPVGKDENGEWIYEMTTYYYTARTYDGGTLYKYDPATGETSVCYEDSGFTIWRIRDIVDGKIFYYGERYRDFTLLNSDYTTENLVMTDIATGESVALSHSGRPIETE